MRCPTCEKRFARNATQFPPFCSERCKLLDLGNWLAEVYRIAGDPAPDPDTELD
ncbi:MAG: DNA gyrase inhibitor YacG [Myxococcales bacterium]|nr:MAG: DNA gyrase inhibitor YacG [Myxococcales bacterium]